MQQFEYFQEVQVSENKMNILPVKYWNGTSESMQQVLMHETIIYLTYLISNIYI